MNRSKKLLLLLGVLAVVCLITVGVSKYEVHREQIKNSDQIILSLPAEDVTALSWEYEGETLAFHKEETWLYDEDENFPVSEKKINEMLEQFQEFGAAFIIEEVEDYGQYGLNDPLCRIEIKTGEETQEISLGDFSTMDSQRYVSIGDGNVYLVKQDPLDEFDAKLSDMILHDKIPDFTRATQIAFAGAESYTVDYNEDNENRYQEDDVYFTEKEGEDPALDTERINSYLQTLKDLNLTDYVSYNASEEELEKYGLESPELKVSVQCKVQSEEDDGEEKEESFVLSIARDPRERGESDQQTQEALQEEEDALAGAEETSDDASGEEEADDEMAVYARVGESGIIYQITPSEYEDLMKYSYDDLRHQEVFYADPADIYQADITLEGASYTLTSEEEEEEKVWYYQGEKLEDSGFLDALTALSAESFTPGQPDQKEEISLKLSLNDEKHPEISIALYRYDGDRCLAVVNGEPVSLVKRGDVVNLVEAVNGIVLNGK